MGLGGHYLCSCVIMLENLLVAVALFAHDGCADLAEPDAMTPAATMKDEAAWDAVAHILCLDGEGAALEV